MTELYIFINILEKINYIPPSTRKPQFEKKIYIYTVDKIYLQNSSFVAKKKKIVFPQNILQPQSDEIIKEHSNNSGICSNHFEKHLTPNHVFITGR